MIDKDENKEGRKGKDEAEKKKKKERSSTAIKIH